MPPGYVTKSVAAAAKRVPGVRRIPVVKLLAAAELALLTHQHVRRLDRDQRRRLIELIRIGKGRRRNLTDEQRDELAGLIAIMEPRLLAGHAVDKLSPLPLPRRLVYGSARSRR